MNLFLKFSKAIDWLNSQIGKHVIWLILASTIISAVNAVVRKAFSMSSNAYLEVQWYLFAGTFLLTAGYTLLNGEHVKIDVVYTHFSKRKQMWIDIFGFAFFLTPFCLAILWYGIPFKRNVLQRGRPNSMARVCPYSYRVRAIAASGLVRVN